MSVRRTETETNRMNQSGNDISQKLAILEAIASLISRSHELQDTLDQICELVTEQMACDVCSIYLLDESGERLVLRATQGLDRKAVGKVTMRVSEGVTGLAVQEMKAIAERNAAEHPRYKYFPETHEEKFTSLLASPIIDRGRPLGVINIQTKEPRDYSDDDIRVVTTIATQVAVIVQNYRLLHAVTEQRLPVQPPSEVGREEEEEGGEPQRRSTVIRGIGASPGISMGRAVVLDRADLAQLFEIREFADNPSTEQKALEGALETVRIQLKDAELRVAERLSDEEAQIFSTHLMILEDEGFLGRMREQIDNGHTALYAVRAVVVEYVKLFEEIEAPYIRDKIADIEDVGKRLLNILSLATPFPAGRGKREQGILVGRRITPSEAIELEARDMVGMISGEGGADAHASILARSFGIPAVVGVESQLRYIREDDFLIVDGTMGNIYVNPSRDVVREFKRARKEFQATRDEILEESEKKPAVTKDGVKVELLANVSIVADVKTALAYQAEGIGLYRTEFLYITRTTFPTEEEQYKVYRKIVRQMKDYKVVIRTLDAGGDKYMPQFEGPAEGNPYLGWRSIRVSLDLVHVFKSQLRAILRASAAGRVAVLLPMITDIDELHRAKKILRDCQEELRSEGIEYDDKIEVGMMIEVPSAALLADQYIQHVDFFSVGSNDLTQYTLAVDRNNQRVAGLFDPLHPAVLTLIDRTARIATKAGKPATICGELGAYPEALPVLIGMGYRSLSMSPASLPLARYVIQSLTRERCERIARRALRLSSAADVRTYLHSELDRLGLPPGLRGR